MINCGVSKKILIKEIDSLKKEAETLKGQISIWETEYNDYKSTMQPKLERLAFLEKEVIILQTQMIKYADENEKLCKIIEDEKLCKAIAKDINPVLENGHENIFELELKVENLESKVEKLELKTKQLESKAEKLELELKKSKDSNENLPYDPNILNLQIHKNIAL